MNPPRKPSPSRSPEKETTPLSLDYDHLLRLSLKYWMVLALGTVLGLVAGYFYAASQTFIYASHATIFVPVKDASVPGGGGDAQQTDYTNDLINTFVQLLQTRDLPERVITNHHLNADPDFLPASAPPVSEDDATGMLAGDISIHIRPTTRLIDINVEHRSPKMAQALANWLAQESISQEFDQHAKGASDLYDHLEKEVKRLQLKAADSERTLQRYEADHHLGGDPENPDDVVDIHLKELTQEYANAQELLTGLKARYGEFHPKLIAAEQAVDELRDEVAKAQLDANKSNGENIGYKALKSEADADRSQLDTMLKDLKDAQSAVNVAIPGLRVVEPAMVNYSPIRPNRSKMIALGGLAGLLCGFCFIFGLYFIDGSIRTVSQAESTLSLPVLAAVPILTHEDGRSILPTFSDPQSFVAESFRGLRASLILHDRENPLKTILVASAIPGEGKSFCAANLAVAFAQAGLKTLLIDADLRLPTLHTYFNLAGNRESNGFTEVLAGRATLASAVIPSPVSALELLLTTTAADSPAELLSGIRLPLLLNEAAAAYDRVVIDTAPLNAVSDTMLIMQKADAILLVVRAAQTPAGECKSALQKIYNNKMKPLGLVLNYLAAHTLKSYSYGYSYGQKPKDKNAK